MCVINMVMECLFKLVLIKYIYRGTKSIGRPRAAPQGPLVIFREKKTPKPHVVVARHGPSCLLSVQEALWNHSRIHD